MVTKRRGFLKFVVAVLSIAAASVQRARYWQKWIVLISGTTKLWHLEENLRSLDFKPEKSEWEELEKTVAAIPIVGSRYNTEQ